MACTIGGLSLTKVTACNDTQVYFSFTPLGDCYPVSGDMRYAVYRDGSLIATQGYFDVHTILCSATANTAYTWKVDAQGKYYWGGGVNDYTWVTYATSGNVSKTAPKSHYDYAPTLTWTAPSTNVQITWVFDATCVTSITSFTIQKYVSGNWTDWKTGVSSALRTYTTTGNTLWTTVTYRVVSITSSGTFTSPSASKDLYDLFYAPVLTGTTGCTGYCAKLDWTDPNGSHGQSVEIYRRIYAVGNYFPQTGIVSYWKFDEGSGTVINDSVGTKNGGLTGAWTASGKINSCPVLSTGGHGIYFGNVYSFKRAEKFSFSCWIKTTTPTGVNQYILCKNASYAGSSPNPNNGYSFQLSNKKIWFRLGANDSGNELSVCTTADVINDTNWHHVVFTYGGTSNPAGVNIYVDGVLKTLTTIRNALSLEIQTSVGLCIGRNSVQTYFGVFLGNIDEAALYYTYVLTQADVDALYNTGSGIQWSAPTSYALVNTIGDLRQYNDWSVYPSNNFQFKVRGKLTTPILDYSPDSNEVQVLINYTSRTPICTGYTITNIGATTADANVEVLSTGGNPVTARGVCWNTTGSPTTADPKTTNGTGIGAFTGNMTGLILGNTYYIRCYATNISGTSYSNELSFTVPIAPTVVTSGLTQTTLTTATGGGNATAGSTITAKGVCWSTGPNPTIANSKTVDGTGQGAFTSTLTGLTQNVLYYVRAYATNSIQTSYGAQQTVTINLYAPVLTGVADNDHVDLSWTDANTEKEHYEIWKTTNCFPSNNLLAYYPFGKSPYTHTGRASFFTNNDYEYINFVTQDVYNHFNALPGKFDSAMYFSNYDQYAYIPGTGGRFERTDKFSYAMWIRQDYRYYPNDTEHLINNISSDKGYSVTIDSANTLTFKLQNSASNYIQAKATIAFPNVWQHLVVTYDGSSNASGLKIYYDGALLSSTNTGTLTATIVNGTSNLLKFGNDAPPFLPPHEPPTDPETHLFYGWMDEIAIWNEAISQANVNTVYNSGTGFQYDPTTALLTTLNTPTTTYTDNAVSLSCIYTYCVKAKFDSYNPDIFSNCSNQFTAVFNSITGPSGLTSSNITITGCTINWVNTNISGVTSNLVQQSTDGTNWITIATVAYNATTYNVTGLNPFIQYYFRVIAVNGLQQAASTSLSVVTLDPAPTNFQSTVVNPGYVTTTWTLPYVYGTSIRAEYKECSSSTWIVASTLASTATGYTFVGLTPMTCYNFKAVLVGYGEYDSAVITNTTQDPTPINFNVTVLYNTGVANWQLPYVYGTSIRAEIRVSGNTAWTIAAVLGSTETDYVYANLVADTHYQIRVVLVGSEYPSAILDFYIPPLYVPNVITTSFSNINLNSAVGSGEVTYEGGTPVTSRGIAYGLDFNPTTGNTYVADIGSGLGTYSCTLPNLLPYTQYYIRAYAINAIGTAYGNNLIFTTKGITSDIFIRFEDNVLFDLEIEDEFEVNYAITDIKNLAEAKTSFTIPIKLPYTKKVVEIFGNLFNITNQSTTTDKQIDCKLIYRDKVILNGFCVVDSMDYDYMKIVLANFDLTLFELIKDKKLNQLGFTGSTYTYANKPWNQMRVDQNNFTYATDTGATHHFVHIDWNGTAPIQTKTNGENTNLLLSSVNRFSPVIRVKPVLDKIFAENGYTYSGSSDFMDKLNGLYMTSNCPVEQYTCTAVNKFYLGYNPITDSWSGTNYKYLPVKQYAGSSINQNTIATSNSSAYPTINRGIVGLQPFFTIGDEYTITTRMNLQSTSTSGEIKITLHRAFAIDDANYPLDPDADANNDIEIFSQTFGAAIGPNVYEQTIIIKPELSQIFGIADGGFTNFFSLYYVRVDKTDVYIIGSPSEYPHIEITTPNWQYWTGNTYTLKDILSNSYTQYNLLNDITTMFNTYLYADAVDKKLLYIKTYDDFYIDDVLDWSNKFSIRELKISDTSKELYNQYNISYSTGTDDINKAYTDNTGEILNAKLVINANPLSVKETNNIKLAAQQMVIMDNLFIPPDAQAITDGYTSRNQPICSMPLKENSVTVFGYINKFKYNVSDSNIYYLPLWGLFESPNNDYAYDIDMWQGAQFDNYAGISGHYLTLSPFKISGTNINEFSDANTFALLFNSTPTFLGNYTGSTLTNNNLYNRYWFKEIDKKVNSQQKFLRSRMFLTEADLKIENFRKRIWIDVEKLGNTYYRLNKIVFPTDKNSLSYVELITESNHVSTYDTLATGIFYGYDYNNKKIYYVKDTSTVTGGTGGITPTQSGQTKLYFGSQGSEIVQRATNFTGSSNITYHYYLCASCDVRYAGDTNQATTTLLISTDGGFTWNPIDNVTAQIVPNDTSAFADTSGFTTVNGLTSADYFNVRIGANWDYEVGDNSKNGYYEVYIQSATGGKAIISPSSGSIGGSDVNVVLS